MRTIRASEIGTYIYCQRAWWYQRDGAIPENSAQLANGLKVHSRHGRLAMTTGIMRLLAYLLILTALVITAIYITLQLV